MGNAGPANCEIDIKRSFSYWITIRNHQTIRLLAPKAQNEGDPAMLLETQRSHLHLLSTTIFDGLLLSRPKSRPVATSIRQGAQRRCWSKAPDLHLTSNKGQKMGIFFPQIRMLFLTLDFWK